MNIKNLLKQQATKIEALFSHPDILSEYMHYRGPPYGDIPIISYNDPNICRVLDNILYSENTYCEDFTVKPLGSEGKIGVPYLIQNADGSELIAKLSKVSSLYSSYLEEPPTLISDINRRGVRQCITNVNLQELRFLASDEFTNETLISYVLNYAASSALLPPLFVKHYIGGVCTDNCSQDYGLNIMEYCDLGPLDKINRFHTYFNRHIINYDIEDDDKYFTGYLLDPDIIFQILAQITVGLHMLQSYAGFVSGDLKAGNVFIKSDPINIVYMDIKLNSQFTSKIADFGKSSCMLPRTDGTSLRFYNESFLSNVYLKVHPFKPDISTEFGEYYYKIGNLTTAQEYARIRHMALPYYSSFDYYTLIVSLLTNPVFYYIFFATEYLVSIFWDPVWNYDGELIPYRDKVMNKIKKYVLSGKGASIADAISILKGLKLKCGAIDEVMKKIRMHQGVK